MMILELDVGGRWKVGRMKSLFDPPLDVLWAILAPAFIVFLAVAALSKENLLSTYDGMLKLTVCSNTPDVAFDKDEIFIDPAYITIITNPPETRKECVKIVAQSGRGIHVYGTAEGIAAERNRALGTRK